MHTKGQVLAFATLIFVVMVSSTHGQVLPTDSVVAGKTMPEWTAAASKFALSFPDGMNPIQDTTGEFSHLGDQGAVFFLSGTFGGPVVTRDVTIRDDQFIHIGLQNVTGWIPSDGETEAEVRAVLAPLVDGINHLSLEIDGVAPSGVNLFDHRYSSPVFDLVFPDNAIFGIPAGSFPAVTEGYSVMLEPLSKGSHTIAFSGGDSEFLSSVVYNVNVVPEPNGLVLAATASLFGLALRRRNRISMFSIQHRVGEFSY